MSYHVVFRCATNGNVGVIVIKSNVGLTTRSYAGNALVGGAAFKDVVFGPGVDLEEGRKAVISALTTVGVSKTPKGITEAEILATRNMLRQAETNHLLDYNFNEPFYEALVHDNGTWFYNPTYPIVPSPVGRKYVKNHNPVFVVRSDIKKISTEKEKIASASFLGSNVDTEMIERVRKVVRDYNDNIPFYTINTTKIQSLVPVGVPLQVCTVNIPVAMA